MSNPGPTARGRAFTRLALGARLALTALAVVAPTFASIDVARAEDEDLVVRQIEIEGLSRIDKQAVRGRIYTQIGRELDRGRLSEDLKRLYAMGFFEDIQVAERPHDDGGLVLTFMVVERPTMMPPICFIHGPIKPIATLP